MAPLQAGRGTHRYTVQCTRVGTTPDPCRTGRMTPWQQALGCPQRKTNLPRYSTTNVQPAVGTVHGARMCTGFGDITSPALQYVNGRQTVRFCTRSGSSHSARPDARARGSWGASSALPQTLTPWGNGPSCFQTVAPRAPKQIEQAHTCGLVVGYSHMYFFCIRITHSLRGGVDEPCVVYIRIYAHTVQAGAGCGDLGDAQCISA